MTVLIEANQLVAGYGQMPVVKNVNLTVAAGEVVALLGPNGAGKTTTMLALSGDIPLLGGSVIWNGRATSSPLSRRAREGLSFVTEDRSVFMGLSVADNLRAGRVLPGDVFDLFPELAPRLRVKVGLLSGGEQQMLTLGRALARRPKLLIIDELSLGLAPLMVQRLFQAVQAASRSGVGVLVVEQHVRKVLEIADRVYVLRRGQVVLDTDARQAAARLADIEQSYLGA
jgi:branched-chain amino acid transport system ATP-binding protein